MALTALADCQYFRHETRDLRIQSVLFGRERAANLQKAIVLYEATLRVSTEKAFPATWADTQKNLGKAYAELPTGDRKIFRPLGQ